MCATIKKRDKNIICFVALKKTFCIYFHRPFPPPDPPGRSMSTGSLGSQRLFSNVCPASDVAPMFLRCNSFEKHELGQGAASDSLGQIQSTRKNGCWPRQQPGRRAWVRVELHKISQRVRSFELILSQSMLWKSIHCNPVFFGADTKLLWVIKILTKIMYRSHNLRSARI